VAVDYHDTADRRAVQDYHNMAAEAWDIRDQMEDKTGVKGSQDRGEAEAKDHNMVVAEVADIPGHNWDGAVHWEHLHMLVEAQKVLSLFKI